MQFKSFNSAVTTVISAVIYLNLVASTNGATPSNPGLKLRLSEAGLNYAAGAAFDALSAKLSEKRIRDQTGSARTPVGKVDYDITQSKVTRFSSSSTSVVVNPGLGLTWKVNDVALSIHGNWNYKYKRSFLRIRDHGGFDGSMSQSSIEVSVSVGMDENSGRPTIRSVACECQIDALRIQLQGGASWLYNLFLEQLEAPLRRGLEEVLCREAQQAIDEDGGAELDALQLVVSVGNKWLFDWSLVAPPNFQSGFVEFFHKGEFLYKDDGSTNSQSEAVPFQMIELDQMVNIGISEYVLNTIANALYRHGIFNYNLTTTDIPPSEQNFLSTSCRGICVGSLIPNIGRAYPNTSVELEILASGPPQVVISSKGIRCSVVGLVTYRTRLYNGSLVNLLRTNISAIVGLRLELNDSALVGTLTGFLPFISVVDSAVGPVTDAILQTMFKLASRLFIVPKLKEVFQKGLPLPRLKNVELVNQKIVTESNYLQIITDIRYSRQEV